jgi:hypothetical protein
MVIPGAPSVTKIFSRQSTVHARLFLHDTASTLPDRSVGPEPDLEIGKGQLEHSPLVELNPQEAMALIQIANAGGIQAGAVSESDLSRLHLLGLVEQRGIAMGLTAMGIQTLARLKRGATLPEACNERADHLCTRADGAPSARLQGRRVPSEGPKKQG